LGLGLLWGEKISIWSVEKISILDVFDTVFVMGLGSDGIDEMSTLGAGLEGVCDEEKISTVGLEEVEKISILAISTLVAGLVVGVATAGVENISTSVMATFEGGLETVEEKISISDVFGCCASLGWVVIAGVDEKISISEIEAFRAGFVDSVFTMEISGIEDLGRLGAVENISMSAILGVELGLDTGPVEKISKSEILVLGWDGFGFSESLDTEGLVDGWEADKVSMVFWGWPVP